MTLLKTTMLYFLNLVVFLILIRAVLSWFIRDLRNPIAAFVYQITEPLLSPFRQIIQKLGYNGMIDFSPILLIITVQMLSNFILRL
ncbi:YggT family protein [Acidaminobacter hydrogenoformans]|uniref:YggT family protein n=1 Tax=Acidaminobacter hydrogenoformans DSM 2784 TaxID=1120920 RepID=A0A1G5RSD7_9FIRM|nr:YggT family protein [Acidaminobacter hydrogenoformans]SCZ76992.1 YggT family protein [Acidaminobacter hydrogenoformans DSM 2784]